MPEGQGMLYRLWRVGFALYGPLRPITAWQPDEGAAACASAMPVSRRNTWSTNSPRCPLQRKAGKDQSVRLISKSADRRSVAPAASRRGRWSGRRVS
jgi:hypothetical protein